jgi:hypothetical protein
VIQIKSWKQVVVPYFLDTDFGRAAAPQVFEEKEKNLRAFPTESPEEDLGILPRELTMR